MVSDDDDNSEAISEESAEKHQEPSDQGIHGNSDTSETVGTEATTAHRQEKDSNACSEETESSRSENARVTVSESHEVDLTEADTDNQ